MPDSVKLTHASEVDNELFSIFSDLFKDEYGFRPRFHVDIFQVTSWLADNRKGEARWPESY